MLRTDSGGDNLFVKLFTQILANSLVMGFWIAKPNSGKITVAIIYAILNLNQNESFCVMVF